MRIQPLGPDGVQARAMELKGRLDRVFGRRTETYERTTVQYTNPLPKPAQLRGNLPTFAPVLPFNPMGRDAEISSSLPSGEIDSMIVDAAANAGVDPALLRALVQAESGFNPLAVSPAGAKGLTQLMPGTAAALGVTDPFDPSQNLNGGARYLRQMLDEFGDIRLALAAYNAGPGKVRRHGGVPPYRETLAYVDRVMAGFGGGNL